MKKSKSRALTPTEVEAFGKELDAVRAEVVADLGARDAKYIKKVQAFVRYTEIVGRSLLFLSWFPPAWLAGVALLSASKIVENMELGHNVMHGQYDWMNDPSLRGDTYEWDHACAGDAWRHSHNYMHHTYTNVVGKDRDVGYGILRLFDEQPWRLANVPQPLYALALALGFEWGIALYDLEVEKLRHSEEARKGFANKLKLVAKKGLRQILKDYVLFPLLAGPMFVPVLAANLVANLVRNLWTFTMIFCGHFTADAETFPLESLDGETRAHWYLRQLKGSSNLTGGPGFHFFNGNLSHQIEHHLYPDLPAHRYAEIAKQVRAICAKYGQHYNTGSLWTQLNSVIGRIFRYSLPTRATRSVTPS